MRLHFAFCSWNIVTRLLSWDFLLWINSKSLLSFVSSFEVDESWKAYSWEIYFSLVSSLVLDPKFSWSWHFQVLKVPSSWRWSHSWRSPPSQLALSSPPACLCPVWNTQCSSTQSFMICQIKFSSLQNKRMLTSWPFWQIVRPFTFNPNVVNWRTTKFLKNQI